MRHAIVLGLCLLGTEAVADAPIPQDPARLEARRQARLAWNRKTLVDTYEAHGKKDPRWDDAARKALDRAARFFARRVDPVVLLSDVNNPARRAVAAGCDDPLILYIHARTGSGRFVATPQEYAILIRAAAEGLLKADCSPYRRAVGLVSGAENLAWQPRLDEAGRQDARLWLDEAMKLVGRSVELDGPCADWSAGWHKSALQAIAAHRRLGLEAQDAFERVDAALAAPGGESLRLAVKGRFFVDQGWEARSNARAVAVTEEQFRAFEGRLQTARTALEDAWRLNPEEPSVPEAMLLVEKGIGGDRAAMEAWWGNAMALDGDDEGACLQKLDWLDPKWHGGDSPAEMLAFGRACRASGNWRSKMTLLVGDGHLRVMPYMNLGDRYKYMTSDKVWDDVKTVYDEYLGHYPNDDLARSKYALLCHYAGSTAEAKEQFNILGDRLMAWTGPPYPSLADLKKVRETIMRTPTFGPRPAPKAAR